MIKNHKNPLFFHLFTDFYSLLQIQHKSLVKSLAQKQTKKYAVIRFSFPKDYEE